MRIAVSGAGGRLGASLCAALAKAGHEVLALGRGDMDICDPAQVSSVMARLRPQVIVNCSAYNAVDAAEADAATAFAVNATGPALLARAATELDAVLVHFSSDFVFDGQAERPYTESDPAGPLSVYGASKAAGDLEAGRTERHYILRVESLFGGRGVRGHRAAVEYLADTLLAGGPVRAFVDRTASPSYVPDVADATVALLERQADYGVYHCVNTGVTTWYDLALFVRRQLGVDTPVEPLLSATVKTAAARPRYCGLSNLKLAIAGIDMPGWQSAVTRHLEERSAAGVGAPIAVGSIRA